MLHVDGIRLAELESAKYRTDNNVGNAGDQSDGSDGLSIHHEKRVRWPHPIHSKRFKRPFVVPQRPPISFPPLTQTAVTLATMQTTFSILPFLLIIPSLVVGMKWDSGEFAGYGGNTGCEEGCCTERYPDILDVCYSELATPSQRFFYFT
jgi:hypothetical protein